MSSSDLELARALSRLLSEPPAYGPTALPTPPCATVPAPDPSRFVRFQREAGGSPKPASLPVLTVPAPSRPAAPPEPPVVEPGGFDAGSLTPFLEWACRAAAADAAFLLDPHGLVVAKIGSLSAEEAEAWGARLEVALDPARAVPGAADEGTAVAIEAGERVVTAFAADVSGRGSVIVGLAGPAHVGRPVREALRKALAGR